MKTQGDEPLNETYRHFNSLIWQVPSWGIAITTAIIVGVDKLADRNMCRVADWAMPLIHLQALILTFGSFVLFTMAITLYRYRHFQAWATPHITPKPPFRCNPSANGLLQGVLCLFTGTLLGLVFVQEFSSPYLVLAGLIAGIIFWCVLESKNKQIVNEINKNRAEH